MNDVSETDKAYTAGILDGEGTIGATANGGSPTPLVSVTIVNTNKELLEWLQAQWGGTIVIAYQVKARAKQVYTLRFRMAEVPGVLTACLPYLRVKRRQAELVLLIRERSGTRTRQEGSPGWTSSMKPEDVFFMAYALEELRNLNQRGSGSDEEA